MKLLLDTHVVLWQLSGVQRLGIRASETIASAAELTFSVVSFAEIGVKAAVGKLAVPDDLHAHVLGTGLCARTIRRPWLRRRAPSAASP